MYRQSFERRGHRNAAKPLSESPYSNLLARIVRGSWVGRSREIAEANGIWQQVVDGDGRVLLVSGEPGVGKTRFVRELARMALAGGGRVLTGECYVEGSSPYAPITQMIGEMLETSNPGDAGISEETLSEALTELAVPVPSLRLRFPGRIPAQSLDPQFVQQRIIESIAALCATLSASKPLLLFFDDVHWADSDTLSLLRNLARRIHQLPILIVMTYREAELESAQTLQDLLLALNRERLSVQIRLLPLDRDGTRDLLAAMFTGEVDAQFLNEIYRQTEGNPFFIEEICKAFIESGEFFFREERWHYPEIKEIQIPNTVRSAIQARLRPLPDDALEALRMAAILGREFDFEILRRALGLEEERLILILEGAVRAQLILEASLSGSGAGRFAFAHTLIPATLRESIIHIRRRRYHHQAAQAIEVLRPTDFEALAYHYTEANEPERAREYFRLAGDRARQGAPAEATRFYKAALEVWPEEDVAGKAGIMAQLGHVLHLLGDITGALQCFEDAYAFYEMLQNRTQSGEMQRMIGRLYWERADQAESMRHYQKALAILQQGPDTPELARAISSISQIYMLTPQDDLAITWGQRAVEMADALQAEDVVVHALNNIGSSYAQRGEFEKGVGLLQQSLQRSLNAGLQEDTCRAYYNLGVMRQRQCRYSQARGIFQELNAYAGMMYAKRYVSHALIRLMWIDWLTGNWSLAQSARALVYDYTSTMDQANLDAAWMKKVFGLIDLDIGKVEEGRRSLEESLPIALRAMDMQTTVAHLGQLVRAYDAEGQEMRMLAIVHDMLELVIDPNHLSDESIMPLFYACQQLAKMVGSSADEEKQSCLVQLKNHAQRYQTGEAAAALAEARGTLETENSTASEYFRQAAAGWESIGRPYDQARSLAAQANAMEGMGASAMARAARGQAQQIFDSLAAQLDPDSQAAFLDSPLVKGVRPLARKAPQDAILPDLKHLTERETEVLRLVAEGLTNVQIAERLVLSPLTINAHLRSIFNKLDVPTRTAAVHRAMEWGLV